MHVTALTGWKDTSSFGCIQTAQKDAAFASQIQQAGALHERQGELSSVAAKCSLASLAQLACLVMAAGGTHAPACGSSCCLH
jgi:hypothetical protein